MTALDTSPEIAALQIEAYRRMGPAGRFKVAVALSDLTHRLAAAGIRQRNPAYSDDEVLAVLVEALYGRRADP
jgi:hypothetical protein